MHLNLGHMAIRTALTTGVALGVALCSGAVAAAQQASPPPPPPPPVTTTVDVDRLPLDLQRIERQLRQSSVRQVTDGINLRFVVDVYGQAPRIQLFTPADGLSTGPVPWGGPTHRDMLEVTTPKEFRAPTADFAAFMKWLSDKMGK